MKCGLRTLYEVFPAIKAFGCCHEVFGTQELLIKVLEKMKGIKGVKRNDIKHETILKAALSMDNELAFRAFVNDPLVTVGIDDARKLFEEMLHNTSKYLNGWDI